MRNPSNFTYFLWSLPALVLAAGCSENGAVLGVVPASPDATVKVVPDGSGSENENPDANSAPDDADGDDADDSGAPKCSSSTITVSFNPAFSGSDGVRVFQVPMRVLTNGLDASVAASEQANYTWDTSAGFASIMATDPNIDPANGGVMVTVEGELPGNNVAAELVVISNAAPAYCGTASLNLTSYDAGLFVLGEDRFLSGSATDAGLAIPDAAELLPYMNLPANSPEDAAAVPLSEAERMAELIGSAGQPCANCHATSSSTTLSLSSGIPATPEQTGGVSDSTLISTFRNGIFPDAGMTFLSVPLPTSVSTGDAGALTPQLWSLFHQWTFDSDEQAAGTAVYLRTLTPAP